MIKLAEQMIKQKQYSEAMEMLEVLGKLANAHGQMYKLASDALIGLEIQGCRDICINGIA